MSRISTNRSLAEGILKTIQRLESDPEVDLQEPAFINLKCTLVKRLTGLEVDSAEIQARIQLVERPVMQPTKSVESAEEHHSIIA